MDEFREAVVDKFEKLKGVFIRKNTDYGNSVELTPMLAPNVTPEEAVRVRISDKINRLLSLLKSDNTPRVNESIIDTMEDTAVYFIILSCLWNKYTTNTLPEAIQSRLTGVVKSLEDINSELAEAAEDEPTALANIDAANNNRRLKVLELDKLQTNNAARAYEGIKPFCLIINGMPKHEHDLDYTIGDIYNSLHLTEDDKETILKLQEPFLGDIDVPFVAKTLEELNYNKKQDVLELNGLFINMKYGTEYFNLLFLKTVMDALNKSTSGIVIYYLEKED